MTPQELQQYKLLLQNEKLTDQTIKEMRKAFLAARRDVKAKIVKYYDKYATGGKLTYTEMVKYNRLKNLLTEIDHEIQRLGVTVSGNIRRLVEMQFKEGYFKTGFALEQLSGVNLRYGQLSRRKIEAAIQLPLSGVPMQDVLKHNRDMMRRTMRQAITQGIIQGESYDRMARRIGDAVQNSYKRFIVVAQTEAHRATSAGALQSMQDAEERGLQIKKVWVATMDDLTRDSHQDLDGVEIGIDENFKGEYGSGPAPGMLGDPREDINCRCTIITKIAGYDYGVRRVRDEGIINYRTYTEWKQSKNIG